MAQAPDRAIDRSELCGLLGIAPDRDPIEEVKRLKKIELFFKKVRHDINSFGENPTVDDKG